MRNAKVIYPAYALIYFPYFLWYNLLIHTKEYRYKGVNSMTLVRDKKFYLTLLTIALPIAFQNLITFAVNMLDTVMVASMGEVAMSSVSLGNQVTNLMMFFVRGMAGGTAVLISQYWGKKDMVRIKSVMGIGMKVCILITTAATLFIFIFPKTVMSFLTNDSQLIAVGAQYIQIVCLSYLIVALSDTMIAMLRCVEVVKVALYVSILSFFINVCANYVLIFGKFGFPALGVQGAAIATVFTRLVEIGIVFIYVRFIDKKLVLRFRELIHSEKVLWHDFFRYGLPIVVGDILWGLVGTVKASIVGRLGAQAVSAYSISEVVLQLATVFIFGLAGGACVMIGKTVGAKQYDLTKQYSHTLQVLFAGVGVIGGLFTFFIRHLAVSFYNVTPETQALAANCLIFGAITIVGTSYAAACFVGINRGAGDSKFVVKTDMICGWGIVIPLTFIAGILLNLPFPVVYLCTRIDQLVKVFIAFFRLRGKKWIKNVTRD